MNVSKLVLLAVALLMSGSICQSQSVQDYDVHLARLEASTLSWEAQINQIDPAQLDVGYNVGKLIDRYKEILLGNIDLAYRYSTNIPKKRSLGSEIELFGVLKEIQSNMDELSTLLAEQSNQKAQSWGQQIGAISGGALNSAEEYQRTSVEHFADELERRCGAAQ
jgi:hypothetical protein